MESGIEELLSALYVDDGRTMHRKLWWGERFDKRKMKFVRNSEQEKVDKKENVDRNLLTKVEVNRAMNAVNTDLKFTIELAEEFDDNRLPTLSFAIWPEENEIAHSYFEKTMRNQVLMMERSSIGQQAKVNIMSNELRRRLEVLSDCISEQEVTSVINKYIQQLTNSGYNWKQQREIIISALKGHVRREKVRLKTENKLRYRSGQASLRTRMEKKLTEKYNWFRRRKRIGENDAQNEKKIENREGIERENVKVRHFRLNRNDENVLNYEKENTDELLEDYPKAVLFVPSTKNSELAKLIRNVITSLKPWTGISIKVVERAGAKLEEILHKSNPWEDSDCKRDICKPCLSESMNSEPRFKNCTRRSIVYKTWCNLCLKKKKNDETVEDEIETQRNKKRKRDSELENIFTYIGETSRSAWERGQEHWKDLEYRRPTSHMMRHLVEFHPDLDPSEAYFRMKIVSSHNSAFERQITEAVLIERNDGDYSMNSKLEYSRTILPKLKSKLGEMAEEDSPRVKKEKEIKEKIKIIQSEFNSKKRNEKKQDKRKVKRIKLNPSENMNDNVTSEIPKNVSQVPQNVSNKSTQSSGPNNIAILDCSNVSQVPQNVSSKPTQSSGPNNIAILNRSNMSNIKSTTTQSSDPNTITILDCSKVSNQPIMSNNKIQTSDPSDITILDCSKVSNQPSIVSNTISQTGSLSDIAMPGCPNVSNKYQKVSESTSQMSDPNNIAKLDCSKVTKSKNKDQINKKNDRKNVHF